MLANEMKRYQTILFAILIALLCASCSQRPSEPVPVPETSKAKAGGSLWAPGLFHGLEVQIAPVAEQIKQTDHGIPIIVSVCNPSDQPITFRSPVSFPVFHGEIEVLCPDGQNGLTGGGCKKKHLMEEVTFAAGETKTFRRAALGQCGHRPRSYPAAEGTGTTTLVLPVGVYTLQFGDCKPVKIEVKK